MSTKILLLGAAGAVGSELVAEFNKTAMALRSSSRLDTTTKWQKERPNTVTLNLNDPETFVSAVAKVDRVFLLTDTRRICSIRAKN